MANLILNYKSFLTKRFYEQIGSDTSAKKIEIKKQSRNVCDGLAIHVTLVYMGNFAYFYGIFGGAARI